MHWRFKRHRPFWFAIAVGRAWRCRSMPFSLADASSLYWPLGVVRLLQFVRQLFLWSILLSLIFFLTAATEWFPSKSSRTSWSTKTLLIMCNLPTDDANLLFRPKKINIRMAWLRGEKFLQKLHFLFHPLNVTKKHGDNPITIKKKGHLHFYFTWVLHCFTFWVQVAYTSFFFTTPSSGLGDQDNKNTWAKGIEEIVVVFKDLLETGLETFRSYRPGSRREAPITAWFSPDG